MMATEPISLVIDEISGTICSAKDVVIGRKSFSQLSTCLGKIIDILEEINKKHHDHHDDIDIAIGIISQQTKLAKSLAEDCCGNRSRVYLLINCQRILKPQLEAISKEIGQALSLLCSMNGAADDTEGLSKELLLFEFRTTAAEEEVLNEIDLGIQERNFTRSYANSLLTLIADAIGVSKEPLVLTRELGEFKEEVANARKSKEKELTEAVQMEQIVALLEKADATLSLREKEFNYSRKRDALGRRALDPLQSFYCPITGEIMEDPVEISSGQTFERLAITKWIADGNTTCPLTVTTLSNTVLRPNITLRKSIEEWKDRNAIIRIASIKSILGSADEEEMVKGLGQLQDLCEEKESYREYVVLENCLKILVGLLAKSNRLIRHLVLSILSALAKDNDGIKELIADVENSVESIVRSLARRSEERKLAVALLLEMSRCEMVRDSIGRVHGCILLLVTISNGSGDIKKVMVATLAEMELTDHSKADLFRDGALEPLLHLVSHGDRDIKIMAVKALQSLSSLHQNGLQMIRKRAVHQFMDLLRPHDSTSSVLQELVAVTIMNIAKSVPTVEDDESLGFLESDDDISWLFSLIISTGPNIQCSILQTFYALGQLPSSKDMRTRLRQFSAIRVLIPLCEHTDLILRASAVKLLSCLMEGGDDSLFTADAGQSFLKALSSIIETSNDEEEIAAAMGIISKLPAGYDKFTQWLLDAKALKSIITFLTDVRLVGLLKNPILENAVGALCFFTVSTNHESQRRAAEAGVIPMLVQLLGSGTALTKIYAATCLAQFSESSLSLSRPIDKPKFFFCCSTPPELGCAVHLGVCSVETSFCLLEADAVKPLVRLLGEEDHTVCEASLKALATLLEGEMLERGRRVISASEGIGPVIRLLTSHDTNLQEKALRVLEKIFQLEEHKKMYGASAQMPLVDIAQRGSRKIRALAARVLAHLDVLHDQSSYF
ncbi:uncharacterized protein A4U43_C08F4210 [Asparagus officinalis]|nr:uncharacterized protein A4U43_C08F4210 [Asparagus officinalis]